MLWRLSTRLPCRDDTTGVRVASPRLSPGLRTLCAQGGLHAALPPAVQATQAVLSGWTELSRERR